jgi:hypothetical protein
MQVLWGLVRSGSQAELTFDEAWQLTGAVRAVAADVDRTSKSDSRPELTAAISRLSELVNYPAAPAIDANADPCKRPSLFQNGDGFDAAKFREQLLKIESLLKSSR